MTELDLIKVSENDRDAIAQILAAETYPRTVKEIRGKLRHTGRDIPEYLISRALRSLLSDGKLHFKGGRWMSNELYDQVKEVRTGFTQRTVERPQLTLDGERALKPDFKRTSEDEEQSVSDQEAHAPRGPWDTFRSLAAYYSECLRNEEGADASAFIEDIGKKYLFASGVGNWHPRTGERWSYVIPMGSQHVADFVQNISLDNIVVLGYPVEAVHIHRNNEPDTRLIRPVFQYILKADFSDNSITLSTSDAQPEISLEWMKYSLNSYSKQFHFLSHCGLINQERPPDEPMGFTSEDIRPDLDELVKRLSSFLPKNIIEQLNCRSVNAQPLPSGFKKGIYNKAVIMIGNRTKYTQTLLKELDAIKSQPDETLAQTSLKHLFSRSDINDQKLHKKQHEETVADVLLLNSEQREAVSSLLTENLTVVTGPPGTGKSQVVMGAVANARLQDQSVLFASRNHKAIDAVVDRLEDNNGNSLIIRTNSKEDPTLNYTFSHAVNDLLKNNLDSGSEKKFHRQLSKLDKLLTKRGEHAAVLDQIYSLRDETGELEENLAWLHEELPESLLSELSDKYLNIDTGRISNMDILIDFVIRYTDKNTVENRITYFFEWMKILRSWFSTAGVLKDLSQDSVLDPFPPILSEKLTSVDVTLLEGIKNYIDWKHKLIPLEESMKELPQSAGLVEDVAEVSEKIKSLTADLLTLHSQSHGGLPADGDYRENMASLNVALKQLRRGFENKTQRDEAEKRLSEFIPRLLQNFPCWAVTNLSAGSRIPLYPGIFDLAVIDEASQCDIASAIPILFRAKRAAVVGDPNQLKHVSKLTIGKDSILRRRAGLIELDDMRYSYRETSLYDLFAQTNIISPHLLRETYRSFSEIAEYSNNVFYKGMLRVATDEGGLKVPRGTKRGIHWSNVLGPVVSAGRSGCVSESEVDAVYEIVHSILVENNFKGSLGVVTPFRQQQTRLQDRIFDSNIPFERLTQAKVNVDTAHGFQGDEKDVMIFSLCSGPDMPRGSLYFVRDSGNLFNVAVSRARAVLHVVGNRDWALKSGIKHIVQLTQPDNKKASAADAGPWSPHESPWEEILYEALIKKDIKCIPQYPVAGRRLDLALVSKNIKIDIEVDSDRYHRNPDGSRKKDDTWRDIQLMGMGWKVMRFWVYNLRDNMGKCVSQIEKAWRNHE